MQIFINALLEFKSPHIIQKNIGTLMGAYIFGADEGTQPLRVLIACFCSLKNCTPFAKKQSTGLFFITQMPS